MFPIFLYSYLIFALIWDILSIPLQILLEFTIIGSWVCDVIGWVVATCHKFLHWASFKLYQARTRENLKKQIKILERKLPPNKRAMAKQVEKLLTVFDNLTDEIKKKIWGQLLKSVGAFLVEFIPFLGTISPTWTMDAYSELSNYGKERKQIQELENKVKSMSIFVSKKAKMEMQQEVLVKRRILQSLQERQMLQGAVSAKFETLDIVRKRQVQEVQRQSYLKAAQQFSDPQSKKEIQKSLQLQDESDFLGELEEDLDQMDIGQLEFLDRSLAIGDAPQLSAPHTQEAYQKALQTKSSSMAISNNVRSELYGRSQSPKDVSEQKKSQVKASSGEIKSQDMDDDSLGRAQASVEAIQKSRDHKIRQAKQIVESLNQRNAQTKKG